MREQMKNEIRFCPRCGVQSIERDRYGEQRDPPKFHCEWLCLACGLGFRVDRSTRANVAMGMAKSMRKSRPPDEVKSPKLRPVDENLNTLRRYAEKIEMPYMIFRSAAKPWKFKFNSIDGICRGSLPFDKAMILIRGYEIAVSKAI